MAEQTVMPVWEQELIMLRREFHRYPESCWTEFRTTARIIEELEKLGLSVKYGSSIHAREKMLAVPERAVLDQCLQRAREEGARPDLLEAMKDGCTGCVTTIQGALPGPTVGIRVDIDCNELPETDDKSHFPVCSGFASCHEGKMHACGHDAHAAIGIGAAHLLHEQRDRLRGKVILAFQPGEEGLRGAASMTAAGVFSECDYFFGCHVGLKSLTTGTVYASARGFLASTKFDVQFHGKPAHSGASPEAGRNALVAAATAVLNLMAIPRHQDGATRVNVGVLHAGTARNVIPAEATMMVETRGISSALNSYMEDAAKRVIHAAAEMTDCSYETRFVGAAGSTECDKPLVEWTTDILSRVEGVTDVQTDFNFGGCEDVVTIMRDVQAHGGLATELIFGMPLVAAHHNNYFDLDERVIGLGARCLAQLALSMGDFKRGT